GGPCTRARAPGAVGNSLDAPRRRNDRRREAVRRFAARDRPGSVSTLGRRDASQAARRACCYPMQAPHAQIKPTGLITVVVRDGVTMLHGVKPDEIHIVRKRERGRAEPVPIVWPEIETALAGLPVGAVRPELAEFDVPALDNS